jgi:hypothetical protein
MERAVFVERGDVTMVVGWSFSGWDVKADAVERRRPPRAMDGSLIVNISITICMHISRYLAWGRDFFFHVCTQLLLGCHPLLLINWNACLVAADALTDVASFMSQRCF